VLGGNNKRIGDKSLRLLEFVTERADANGNLPRAVMLVQEWDDKWIQQRSRWCYGTDARTYWYDLGNAQRSLTNSRRAGLFLEAGVSEPEHIYARNSHIRVVLLAFYALANSNSSAPPSVNGVR
jgi:hypothetical protein